MPEVTTIRSAMSSPPIAARPEMTVHQAMDLLLEHEVSGLPVVDERGDVVGILTERDCLNTVFEAAYHLGAGRTVAETMTRGVETVDADGDLFAAIDLFRTRPYRRFPVLQGTHLVGVLSRRDVLRALRAMGSPRG
jgi:CBS domain-containing protein